MKELKEYLDNFPKKDYGIFNYSVGIVNNNKKLYYNAKENEIYDLASITKLFTLNIIYNLEKQSLFKYTDGIDTYLDLPNLNNYSIMEIIRMKGILKVDCKLSDTKSLAEFQQILKTVKVIDNNETEYNDIGFCLLGNLIEKVTGKSLKENFMNLFKELGLQNTKVLPDDNYIVLGNGNDNYLPHDHKTRINNGLTGAAGVFSNVFDLEKYAEKLMNYEIFAETFIKDIFDYNFIDKKNRNRSYAGLYKYTKEYRSYVSKSYSEYSLAHQGFTGAMFLIDFKSKITNILLFDAIEKDSKIKKDNFFEGYYQIQNKVEETFKKN